MSMLDRLFIQVTRCTKSNFCITYVSVLFFQRDQYSEESHDDLVVSVVVW